MFIEMDSKRELTVMTALYIQELRSRAIEILLLVLDIDFSILGSNFTPAIVLHDLKFDEHTTSLKRIDVRFTPVTLLHY